MAYLKSLATRTRTIFHAPQRCSSRPTVTSLVFVLATTSLLPASEPLILDIWPDEPPGETKSLPAEADQTQPDDQLIAGKRVMRLGNVSTPQIAVYRPDNDGETNTAVLICPGGGHHILAYDLEGTEIAHWLNSIGVTGIVLKYRVPFRDPERRWRAAVQDAQRAMSLIRSKADEWKIAPKHIGICGFSAGGETAALTSIFLDERKYDALDAVDNVSCRPNFAMLIYPGGLVEKGQSSLREHIKVTDQVPPMFLVHAFNDRVSPHNSIALATELTKVGVRTELHVYASGGHGYGARKTHIPVTRWTMHAQAWLQNQKIISPFFTPTIKTE